LDVGGCSSFVFQAPPVWTERIFEVKASDLAKPFPKGGSGEDGWLSLLACAPARLQVAALALYRDDCAPFSMLPEWRSALTSLQPGALRLWSAYSCKDSLSLLSEAAFASPCFDMVRDSGSPQLTLPESLRLCVECGAVPWLLLDPLRPPGFFQELAEYLGAPPDVGFGRLRSAQGRPKPWTADIPAFVVEFAYEPWSKSCAPLDWRSSPEDFVDAALYAKGVLSGNPNLKNVLFAMPRDAASQARLLDIQSPPPRAFRRLRLFARLPDGGSDATLPRRACRRQSPRVSPSVRFAWPPWPYSSFGARRTAGSLAFRTRADETLSPSASPTSGRALPELLPRRTSSAL
jgi:hypothetical protein